MSSTQVPLPALQEWARKHGAVWDPRLAIYEDPDTGASFRVLQSDEGDVMPGTRLMECPYSLSISFLNALDVLPQFPSRTSNLPAEFIDQVEPRIIGIVFLAIQYLLGGDSFWAPYIKALPQPDEPHKLRTPAFFTQTDMKWIAGTNIEQGLEDRLGLWAKDFDISMKILEQSASKYLIEGLTWDLYKWAATIYSSRSFTSKVISSSALEVGLPSTQFSSKSLAKVHQRDQFPILFPLMDVPNHDPYAKVEWLSSAKEGGSSLVFIMQQQVSSGKQIFNNYGPKSNTELLMGYGFLLPDNDVFFLSFKHEQPYLVFRSAMGEAFFRQILDSQCFEEVFSFALDMKSAKPPLSSSGPFGRPLQFLPKSVVSILTAIAANDREVLQANRLLQRKRVKWEEIAGAFGSMARNTFAVVSEVHNHLKASLARIMANDVGKPKNLHQDIAKTYRDGQISVLQHNISVFGGILGSGYDLDEPCHILTLEMAYQQLKMNMPNTHEKTISLIERELEVSLPKDWSELIAEDWSHTLWALWVYIQLRYVQQNDFEVQKSALKYSVWARFMLRLYQNDSPWRLTDSLNEWHGSQDELETLEALTADLDPIIDGIEADQTRPTQAAAHGRSLMNCASVFAASETIQVNLASLSPKRQSCLVIDIQSLDASIVDDCLPLISTEDLKSSFSSSLDGQ